MKKFMVLFICVVFMMVGFGCSGDSSDSSSPAKQTAPPQTLTAEDGGGVADAACESGFCTENKTALGVLSLVVKDETEAVKLLVNKIISIKNKLDGAASVEENNNVNLALEDIGEKDGTEIIEGSCGGTLTITTETKDTITFVADNFCDEEQLDATGRPGKVEFDGSGKITIDCPNENETTTTVIIDADTAIKATMSSSGEPDIDIDVILNVDVSMTTTCTETEQTTTIVITTCDVTDNIESETLILTGTIINTDTFADDVTETTANLEFSNSVDGSVIVSTPVSVVTNGDFVVEGEVLVAGEGNTAIRILVVDKNTFNVAVDTTGDGTYDHDSGTIVCNTDI